MITVQQIKKDHLEARKAKDKLKINLLSVILGEVDRTPPDKVDVEKIILKLIKSNSDSITHTKSDNATHELATENAILMTYLPQQLEGEKLSEFVTNLNICLETPKGAKIKIVLDS